MGSISYFLLRAQTKNGSSSWSNAGEIREAFGFGSFIAAAGRFSFSSLIGEFFSRVFSRDYSRCYYDSRPVDTLYGSFVIFLRSLSLVLLVSRELLRSGPAFLRKARRILEE